VIGVIVGAVGWAYDTAKKALTATSSFVTDALRIKRK